MKHLIAFLFISFTLHAQYVTAGFNTGASSPAYVNSASAAFNGTTATTSAASFVGANLLVAFCSSQSSSCGISDSSGNTWTAGTCQVNSSASVACPFWVINPTVTSSQTFSSTIAIDRPSIFVFGFSSANGGQDQSVGSVPAYASTAQFGSLTPSQNNEVIVSFISCDVNTSTMSIDSSFTGLIQQASTTNSICGAGAYLIQTTAGAVNPTWAWTTNYNTAGMNISFKP